MFTKFLTDDHGGVIIEYGLILAVISIALVIALQSQMVTVNFGALATRITNCLTSAVCV